MATLYGLYSKVPGGVQRPKAACFEMRLVWAVARYKIQRWINGGQYPTVQVVYALYSRGEPNTSGGEYINDRSNEMIKSKRNSPYKGILSLDS